MAVRPSGREGARIEGEKPHQPPTPSRGARDGLDLDGEGVGLEVPGRSRERTNPSSAREPAGLHGNGRRRPGESCRKSWLFRGEPGQKRARLVLTSRGG